MTLLRNSMENIKSPGNDGLSNKFYEVFWDDVKIPLLASLNDNLKKTEVPPKNER